MGVKDQFRAMDLYLSFTTCNEVDIEQLVCSIAYKNNNVNVVSDYVRQFSECDLIKM